MATVTIKYINPDTKQEVIENLDDSVINVPDYIQRLHEDYLCKDYCDGLNCRVWMFRNDDWTLLGVP